MQARDLVMYRLIIALASVTCILAQSTGDVRLVDRSGSISTSGGRLDIYFNRDWGTVCADDFDVYEADIVCQQLGYLYADRVGTVGELGYLQGSNPILLDNVVCSNSDTRLIDCSYSTFPSCSFTEIVGIRCSNTANTLRLVSQTNRTTDLSAGRLEIFINDEWGTVCDDGFDINDANVACRQMGLTEAVGYGTASNLGYSSSLSIPIWLDDVTCFSSTSNLRTCSHSGTGRHNCGHGEDVILSCLAGSEDGDLRLVSTISPSSLLVRAGRLEIYLRGVWGTVCDDSFSRTEAEVACRQLGYAGVTSYGSFLGFPSPPSSTPILLDNVFCSSSDTTLISCDHNGIGVHNCAHSEDVELRCSFSTSTTPTSDSGGGGGGGGGSTYFPFGSVVGAVVGGCCFLIFFCIPIVIVVCATCNAKHRGNRRCRNIVVAPPPRATVVTATTGNTSNFAYTPQAQQAPPPHPSNDKPYEYPTSSTLQQAPPPSYDMATAYPPPSYPVQPQYTQEVPPQAAFEQPPQAPYPPQGAQYPPQAQYPPPDPAYPPTQTTAFTTPYPSEAPSGGQDQAYPPPPPGGQDHAPSAPPL